MKRILLLLACLATLTGVFAQTPFKGRIVDEQGQPFPYVNVVLLSLPDSAYVAGAVSGDDGCFSLPASTRGRLLRASFIGYTTLYKEVAGADIGTLALQLDAQMLGEVTVRANLPKVRLKGDAQVTTVQGSVLERAGTGNDLLNRIPGLSADEGAVSVFGSGSAEGVPSSRGVLADTAKHTHVVEYNDAQAMADLLERDRDIACVIMEPVLGNVGVIPPQKGYLEEVRRITEENDVVLIFDEVITGFRVSSGGAQKRYGVTPDMTTMAKIVGGGFPAGAFMGRREIMENIAPEGPVYVAGTFAGNPISATAGLAQIDVMCSDDNYAKLERTTQSVVSTIRDSMQDAGVRGCVNSVASMFAVFFGPEEVTNGTQAETVDRAMFDRMFRYMLAHGVYLPPSALEDDFMSVAHDEEAVAQLEEAFKGFFSEVKG